MNSLAITRFTYSSDLNNEHLQGSKTHQIKTMNTSNHKIHKLIWLDQWALAKIHKHIWFKQLTLAITRFTNSYDLNYEPSSNYMVQKLIWLKLWTLAITRFTNSFDLNYERSLKRISVWFCLYFNQTAFTINWIPINF
jgi:hypothetical protein